MGIQVYSFAQEPNVKIQVQPGKCLQLIGAGHFEDHRFIINRQESLSF